MNDLDKKLRDYYEAQELSDDAMDRILAAPKIERPRFSVVRAPWLLVAAAAVVGLLIVASTVLIKPTIPLEMQVVAQVEKNHSKQLPPEIWSAQLSEIQAALPKLNFPIAPTRPDLLAGLSVQGGRYCSILDELAAQISMVDAAGRPCTLYIAPLTPELGAVPFGAFQSGETEVQIWQDAHRLFALARPKD